MRFMFVSLHTMWLSLIIVLFGKRNGDILFWTK